LKIGFLHQPNDPYTIVRMKYFVSKGHKVFSVTFPSKTKQQPSIDGLTNVKLPDLYLNRLFLLKRIIYSLHIRKITKKLKLDIFHVVNAQSLILAAFSASRKTVIENQGSDVLVAPHKYPWLKYIYRFYYKYIDAVIQDSQVAKKAGLTYGAPRENNEVIEIGIDFTLFNKDIKKGVARKKLNFKNNTPFVFSSRGMKEIYNIDTIIKSIPKVKVHFPDVMFVFAANYGELPENLNSFIDNNNLRKNIHYTGWLDHEKEIPYYYRDANVVVSVPSSDSSPFSVYEAMAMKTPVIVSALPWLKDKFISNTDLMIVPVRDEDALSSKIIQVLKNNSFINLESAYNVVYEQINMVKENRRLENLYISILGIQIRR